MKGSLKTKRGSRKIGTRKSDPTKSKGDTWTVTTTFWECTSPSSEAKGGTENRAWKRQARPLPERQKSETVGRGRQLQADTMLQKEMLVKTRKRKKAGVFVESCRAGGFEGHVMCLVSSGSKCEATSFLSLSVSLYVDSTCLFLSDGILQKYRKDMKYLFLRRSRASHPWDKKNQIHLLKLDKKMTATKIWL